MSSVLVIAATNSNGGGNPLFFIGAVLWVVPCFLMGVAMTRGQREYLRHYRTVRGIRLPLSGESGVSNDWRGFSMMAKSAPEKMRAYREPQPEPELEEERRGLQRIQRRLIAWAFIGALLAFGLGIVGEMI